MGETPDNDKIRGLARKDATRDIAEEIPFGGRRGVSSTVINESLDNVVNNTQKSYENTEKRIKKEGTVGGSKVS